MFGNFFKKGEDNAEEIEQLKKELKIAQERLEDVWGCLQDINSVVAQSIESTEQIKTKLKEEVQVLTQEMMDQSKLEAIKNNAILISEISTIIHPKTELDEKLSEAKLMTATAELQRQETLERIENAKYRQIESQLKTHEVVQKAIKEGKVNQVNL